LEKSLHISPLWKRGDRGDFINKKGIFIFKSPLAPLCQRGVKRRALLKGGEEKGFAKGETGMDLAKG